MSAPPHAPGPDAAFVSGGSISARARGLAGTPAYLSGLNPEQRRAVEAIEGPVLVLAGAGTGKTRVLTTRLAHIIASGRAREHEILAVTFTNKAAREMKERIGAIIGPAAEGMPWLGTFHAVCVKLLRRHAELVGLKSGFTILDTDDQIRLMKQVLAAENIDDKRWPARQLAGLIDSWKNRALTPDKVPTGEAMAFAGGKGQVLYRLYQERLKALNACDFGDLLLEAIRLFQENPDVLRLYQERFKYLLVDEYQDTNTAQYLWLRLLAQGRKNICCVGDDDQSIYGWRGAEVDNILRFEHDFPGATVVRLERNYRSTGHILGAASHLIAHNEGRLGKTLFTDGEAGDKLRVGNAWDSEEEARVIAEDIEAHQHKGHALNDIAILTRTTAQLRAFEERFATNGIPYRIIGGPRFYERLEVRDALAYFRCVTQPADDLAFERILNTPKRGLADATLNVLHAQARATAVPLQHAARMIVDTEELKPKPRKALRELMDSFTRWAGQIEEQRPQDLAELVLEESGYTDMWKADRSADAQGRLDNLKELVRFIGDFETLTAFLEHVSLVMEAAEGESEDRVTAMTLHQAKGLEYETVYLPGWEEGLFPSQRALDDNGKAGLEEERRLAYVGITRAKRRATIYFANNRRIHGLWQSAIPSRFVDELPEAHVDVLEAGSAYGGYGRTTGTSRFDRLPPFQASSYGTPGWRRAQAKNAGGFTPSAAPPDFGPGRRGNAARGGGTVIEGELVVRSTGEPGQYTPGARVFHQKFGMGTVATTDGNKATVDFDHAGRKMVLESFLRGA